MLYFYPVWNEEIFLLSNVVNCYSCHTVSLPYAHCLNTHCVNNFKLPRVHKSLELHCTAFSKNDNNLVTQEVLGEEEEEDNVRIQHVSLSM